MSKDEFLVRLSTSIPDEGTASGVMRLAQLYNQRLWHQLTDTLLTTVSSPYFAGEGGADLLELYVHFVKDIEDKLNPFRLAQVCDKVAAQYADHETAKEFLEAKIAKFVDQPDALLYTQCCLAHLLIGQGDVSGARSLLDSVLDTLDTQVTVDSKVFSKYHYVSALLAKQRVDASAYCKAALAYLAYTPIEQIPIEQQRTLSRDVALAALVSPDVYSFGEIISQAAFESIRDDEYGWLAELTEAFNAGKISAYQELCAKYQSQIDGQQTLVDNKQALNEKIAILSLIELVFSRPAKERTIAFSEIAAASMLPVNEVELLVMRALSLGLVKGRINQVAQTCSFSWVVPRVLSQVQIQVMSDKIAAWREHVKSSVGLLEDQASELFA